MISADVRISDNSVLQDGILTQQLLERGLLELGTTGDGTGVAFLSLTLTVESRYAYRQIHNSCLFMRFWGSFQDGTVGNGNKENSMTALNINALRSSPCIKNKHFWGSFRDGTVGNRNKENSMTALKH